MTLPLESRFDGPRFWRDILRAISRRHDDGTLKRYIQQRGLRFLIQTERVLSSEAVRQVIVRAWGDYPREEVSLSVEPLFSDSGDQRTPENLALFHLAVIERVYVEDLEENPFDACYALMEMSEIRSVQPDLPYTQFVSEPTSSAGGGPVNPSADKAWALRNMRVDSAWALTPSASSGHQKGLGSCIAHLDTGWTIHDDLDQQNFFRQAIKDFINPNWNAQDPLVFGSPGHGTRTGSVMMSKGGVSTAHPGTTPPGEITGVAPEANYSPIRCITSVVVIFAGDIARAVRHATANSCHIISMSLGGRPARALRFAIMDAVNSNMLVVAAAGNQVRLVVWPGRYRECVTLAASNIKDLPWSGTSRGKAVDVSAPGEDVWVAEPNLPPSGTSLGSGTSYATAHAAGVAALWLAFHGRQSIINVLPPNTHLQDIFRDCLRTTARTPAGWDKTKFGAGIVDAKALLSWSIPTPLHSPLKPRKAWYLDLSFLGEYLVQQLTTLYPDRKWGNTPIFYELANLEMDHGHQDPLQNVEEARGWARKKMSRFLRGRLGIS
jgi:subtilisin family serine protease